MLVMFSIHAQSFQLHLVRHDQNSAFGYLRFKI
jgi:hypothetical protein